MSPLALSLRFLQTQPDCRLTELAADGHERAFEALVQRYRKQLLAYCRRLTGSDAAAEDVLQQGLMQAWVALRGPGMKIREIKPWLYRIVHNAAISHLRGEQSQRHNAARESASAVGADVEVERRLEARRALAGLAALPEPQRHVMLGTALDGNSHEDVAAALGLSNGAIRGLIYRARATIRAAAAAFIPAPVVNWAARQAVKGGAGPGVYQTVAGGGASGIGALLLKGGALVVGAGVLATTATVAVHRSHPSGHHLGSKTELTGASATGGASRVRAAAAITGNAARGASGPAARGAPLATGRSAGADHTSLTASPTGQTRSGGSTGSGGSGSPGGPGDSSGSGAHGSATGSSGGSDGGSRSGPGSSGSGGSGSGGSDGGSSGGSGGSGSPSSGSDGGGSGGSDGGSSSGGSSTKASSGRD